MTKYVGGRVEDKQNEKIFFFCFVEKKISSKSECRFNSPSMSLKGVYEMESPGVEESDT